jgi:hypothetical protein
MGPRGRELFGLLPVTLLVTAGFTAVLIARGDQIEDATMVYGAIFLGACVVAHVFIRARLPDADPYMFPLAALLAAFGLVEIYRINPDLAIKQAGVFGLGLGPSSSRSSSCATSACSSATATRSRSRASCCCSRRGCPASASR